MQVKIAEKTIETYSLEWLGRSKIVLYIQTVAAGGALAGNDLYQSAKKTVVEWLSDSSSQQRGYERSSARASK